MKKLVFYRCKHCGNVSIKLYDRRAPMFCCGEQMEILNANTTDAATEKHVPVVTMDGNVVTAVVGEVEHPMTAEHYITNIVFETNMGYYVRSFSSIDKPFATYTLQENEQLVRVYEYCNLHGLWVYNA